MLIVLPGEEAAALECDLHRLQIVGLDDIVDGPAHAALVGGLGVAIEPEQLFGIAAHRQRAPPAKLRSRRQSHSACHPDCEWRRGFDLGLHATSKAKTT